MQCSVTNVVTLPPSIRTARRIVCALGAGLLAACGGDVDFAENQSADVERLERSRTGAVKCTGTGACNDNNPCTYNDVCVSNVCRGRAYSCDDGNTCTADSCNGAGGCGHAPVSGSCDDGNACTQSDHCSAGACSGSPIACNDGNVCTDDSCNPASGCVFTNNTASCNDGNACTFSDSCSGGACTGTAYSCNDGNVCTADICDGAGGCTESPVGGSCNDGNSCTTNDTCVSGVCQGTAATEICGNGVDDDCDGQTDEGCSASASLLAFAGDVEGNVDIFVMNDDGPPVGYDGAGATRLTTDAAVDNEPAWSPDHSHIAFTSTRDGAAEIYVMQADGSNQIRLTTGGGSEASWSHEGTQIAFVRNYAIHVMNADGSNVHALTSVFYPQGPLEGCPAWSPDGSKIAYVQGGCWWGGDIYVMNTDGSARTELTGTNEDAYPAWSPDGSTLAFSRITHYSEDCLWHDVFTIDANGSNLVQRTSAYWSSYTNPSWSPDGEWLAYEATGCCAYDCPAPGVMKTRIIGTPTEAGLSDEGIQPAWRR